MAKDKLQFTKIGSNGEDVADGAESWEAVRDNRTGLIWSVKERRVDNQQEAAKIAESITDAGFSDWRLPTVEELFPLADRGRIIPAIDTDLFPDCKSDWYWTSTPYAASPGGYAWGVYFGSGFAYWDGRGSNGFVRAVRPGQ